MRQSSPFLVESHNPATFSSRGVTAPFTTPMLTGSRVRESASGGFELVVPNPSGGRGVYVLDWPGVRALGVPTVHDTVLFKRLAGIPRLDPGSMRDAALEVACEGFAGREAIETAKLCVARDGAQRLQSHFLLTISLIGQVTPTGAPARDPADVGRRVSAILHQLAPMISRSAQELGDALGTLGTVFAPVGMVGHDKDARVAHLLARIGQARASLSEWLRMDQDNDAGGLGRSVEAAIAAAEAYGRSILDATRMVLNDPVKLLKHWFKAPEEVIALTSRADWVLDGWDWICSLWLAAENDEARRLALLEMAPLVPVLPGEISEWAGTPAPPVALQQPCRVTSRQAAARTGAAIFALIGRNERLRAMGA